MTSYELISWLRGLLEAPLPGPDEEESWFLKAKPFLEQLNDLDISPKFFEFIHHYVSDADIRRKDSTYRTNQDSELKTYLAEYESKTNITME